MIRGSRKHVLDWPERATFPEELLALVSPVRCRVTSRSVWRPRGYGAPREARLETFGPAVLPELAVWPALSSWWLARPRGANTPNWDIAFACEIADRPGLILVEAKANVPELSASGKRLPNDRSPASEANHKRIGAAIGEARVALQATVPGIAIDRDRHYQLSNRIAFAWRLASLGVPTVLLYLGFTGDGGIRDVGEPFADGAHWDRALREHLAGVCPVDVLDRPVECGAAAFTLMARSRPVLQPSPPAP